MTRVAIVWGKTMLAGSKDRGKIQIEKKKKIPDISATIPQRLKAIIHMETIIAKNTQLNEIMVKEEENAMYAVRSMPDKITVAFLFRIKK